MICRWFWRIIGVFLGIMIHWLDIVSTTKWHDVSKMFICAQTSFRDLTEADYLVHKLINVTGWTVIGIDCDVLLTGEVNFGTHGPLVRYVKLRVAHARGMPGTFSPLQLVSDPDMHHGTCVTHVPWCMLGSLNNGSRWSRWRGKRSDIPVACATRNFAYLVRGPLQRERAAYATHKMPISAPSRIRSHALW